MAKQVLRAAAYLVCVEDDKILLARWVGSSGKRWTLPGGGIEHGEDPYDAAIREAEEETGYLVEIDALLGIDTIRRRLTRGVVETDWHGMRVVYSGRVVGGELRFEVGGSTDRAEWVALAEVAELARTDLVDVALEMARLRPPTGHL